MLFNSFTFIFVFLPVSLLLFYMIAKISSAWAALWLALASIFFYYWWSATFTFLLLGSITFNYLVSIFILRSTDRPQLQTLALTAGIIGNITILFYFKYFFPLISSLGIEHFSTATNVILPLGISFFTFTQIGYLIDCRAGTAKRSNLVDYTLFVTFFPHLIAGPILHHREMMPQFANAQTYAPKGENLAIGLGIFAIGLAKKVILADSMSGFVGDGFSHPAQLSTYVSWLTALAYSLQLYFDFSGYSDMAVGLARMFGIRFPANFNSPFKATSIIDFWQRWHMTLSRYLNLYLYAPMSLWITRRRLAKSQPVSRAAMKTIHGFLAMIALPTFYTMILAGIWHGAGMQFFIFGLLHAFYLTVNHATRIFWPPTEKAHPHWKSRLITTGKILLTYSAVVLSLVFFRANSAGDALNLVEGMLGLHHVSMNLEWEQLRIFILLVICFGIIWIMPNSNEIFSAYRPVLNEVRPAPSYISWHPRAVWGFALGSLAAIGILLMMGTSEFLYFHF